MGTFSIWHWLIVGAVVLVLFGGRGKISGLLGDLGKGLKAFKNNIKDDDARVSDAPSPQVSHQETVGDSAKTTRTATETEKQNS